MAIVVHEKYKGITGDATGAELLYLVEGTDADAGTVSDEDAFDAVGSSAPSSYRGFPLSNIQIREELLQGTWWLVAAIYGGSAGDSTAFPQSTVEYEFSFQAPAEKILQSIQTIGVYDADGPLDPSFSMGAINVQIRNGDVEVDGIDLPGGSPNAVWVYKPLYATVTDAYQSLVESRMGDVNNFPFKGRPAGTMRFVSCDGGALFNGSSAPKWQIRFGFEFRRNRSNFTVGGINVPFKAGHHLLWAYYKEQLHDPNDDPAPNPANADLIKVPKFVFVEQVFFESNHIDLGLG